MASDFATAFTGDAQYNDTTYPAIITDQVKDALMATVITPALLDFHDLSGQASRAVQIPKADKFTAASVAQGTELTNTALTSTSVTLTSAEIGIQATITDVLEVSDIPAAHGARLKQLGRAMGDKVDVDICALFGGFTTAIGATTVNINLGNLLDAIYNLEVNDASELGSLVGVFHPRQTADLRAELEADQASIYVSGGNPLGKSMNGFFMNWFDIDIFQSTNVPTANAGDDRSGAVFVRNYALGMVHQWAAKIETMRWAPIRGFVLVATAMYGVGEIENSAGVAATTDA